MPEISRTLLAVLVDRDESTHAEIVSRYERYARDNGEDATLSVRTPPALDRRRRAYRAPPVPTSRRKALLGLLDVGPLGAGWRQPPGHPSGRFK